MSSPRTDDEGPAFFTGVLHMAMAQRPRETAHIIARLARPVQEADDLLELLQSAVDVAVETIGAADHASITVEDRGRPFTAVHTDQATLEVDREQYRRGEGPCLEAVRTGGTVLVDVGADDARWSHFLTDARRAGITSVLAAPLGVSGRTVGALNLYGSRRPGLGATDAVLLQVLVEQAARAVQDLDRLRAAQDTAAQLVQAMESRAPIEQAKGILMAVHQVDDTTAFSMLRAQSQNSNRKLREVAAEFVARYSEAPAPGGDLP